jgi:hypothetical protein
VSTLADLRPGMIGFGPIDGPARWPVWAGQLILGEGFTVGPLKIEHVFVVTEVSLEGPSPAEAASALIPDLDWVTTRDDRTLTVKAVEAMPSGAREVTIEDRWTPEYAYVQLPEDYPGQGEDAAAIARAMIGTPYSFASYPALSAWRFGMHTPKLEAWIGRTRKGIMPPGLPCEAICSVLGDQSWALTGKQVMPKGTPHQCVTPGALGAALLEMPGAEWLWPGR